MTAKIMLDTTLAAGTYLLVPDGPTPVPPDPPIPPDPPVPVGVRVIELPWGAPYTWESASGGGFYCGGVIAWRIAIPADAPVSSIPARFTVSQNNGGGSSRSRWCCRPCREVSIRWIGSGIERRARPVSISYAVGIEGAPNLNLIAGQTYFLNLRDWSAAI